MITPQLHYITKESDYAYWHGQGKSDTVVEWFKTYRELKKNLKRILDKSIDADGVCVLRSRRGEWGEWFEYWKLDVNDKPVIDRKGWN